MSLSFTRAVEVSAGDPITSRQFNPLAKAVNDRLLSGVADSVWRIVWEVLSLTAQIRNPSEPPIDVALAALWPPSDEWLRIYGLLKPDEGHEWPVTGPGQWEGLNLANPLNALIYGSAASGLGDEAERFEDVIPFSGTGLWDAWEWAKGQRGAIFFTATSNGQDAPAIRAARAHNQILAPYLTPYLKTYGGFQPTREATGDDCGDGSNPGEGTPTYHVYFHRVNVDVECPIPEGTPDLKHYIGFCAQPVQTVLTPSEREQIRMDYESGLKTIAQLAAEYGMTQDTISRIIQTTEDSETPSGVLAGIVYGTDYYYIWDYDSNGDRRLLEALSVNEWIEGPYCGGGQLEWGKGEQLNQTLNYFNAEWRGAQGERPKWPAWWKVQDISFDNQQFFRDQYFLSPQYGHQSGDTVVGDYQQFNFAGVVDAEHTYAAGSIAGNSGYDIHEGFVLAGFVAKATGLKASATFSLIVDGQFRREFTLTPDEVGYAEALVYFTDGDAIRRPFVGFETVSGFTLLAGGSVIFQIAELLDYKPGIGDAYVVLRLASTDGGTPMTMKLDAYGRYRTELAKAIWQDYVTYGCICNARASAPGSFIQTDGEGELTDWSPPSFNPLNEAARLFNIENVRLATRERLVGYEVVGGKSVLYYERYYPIAGTGADIWRDIAAPMDFIAPGNLIPRQTYKVVGGTGSSVTYNGTVYQPNQTFVATDTIVEYTSTGGALPFQVEGIIATAPPRHTSNRWCCFLNLNAGDPDNEQIIWKDEVYDPDIRLHNRCHTLSSDLTSPIKRDLKRHFNYGLQPILKSEAPTGYTYARGINNARLASEEQIHPFYRSCRIYEPPYEIVSATNEDPADWGGKDVVRIQLDQRLRHYHSGFNEATDVPYRTDENAITQYLAGLPCDRMVGDVAVEYGAPWGVTQGPRSGSCYPRLYMVRLIPEVHEDANDVGEKPVDTRFLIDAFLQMDKYGRCMCEGFIDETKTQDTMDCSASVGRSYLVDYTAENWFQDAVGSKWVPILPLTVRGSLEKGFGPLAMQKAYAEIFNCYAKAFNKLVNARVEIPMDIEVKYDIYTGFHSVTPDWIAQVQQAFVVETASPAEADTLTTESDDWTVFDTDSDINITSEITMSVEADPGGGHRVRTQATIGKYRFKIHDDDAVDAIPPDVYELLRGGGGFLGSVTTFNSWLTAQQVTTQEQTQTCNRVSSPILYFFGENTDDGWFGYAFPETTESTPNWKECAIFTDGSVVPDQPHDSGLFWGYELEQCQGGTAVSRKTISLPGNRIEPFIIVPTHDA